MEADDVRLTWNTKDRPWEKKKREKEEKKKKKSSHPYDFFVSRHGLTHALGAKKTHGHKGDLTWEQTAYARTHTHARTLARNLFSISNSQGMKSGIHKKTRMDDDKDDKEEGCVGFGMMFASYPP